MGFRYHRSRQIIPGVRLNMSKAGGSLSFGVRGARVNVGSKGVRTTVSIPGSGISYVKQENWSDDGSNLTTQQWKTLWIRTLTRLAIYMMLIIVPFMAYCLFYILSGPHPNPFR